MKLRVAMVGVGLTAAVATAVWAVWPRAAETPELSGPKQGQGESAQASSAAQAAPRMDNAPRLAGSQYAVEYHMQLEAPALDASAGMRQEQADLRLTGVLEVGLPVRGDGLWLPVRFRDVKVTANRAALAAAKLPQDAPEQVLQTRMLIAVAADGQLGEARFDVATPTPARALLTGLVQSAQFISGKQGEASWQVQEADANYAYLADYQQESPHSVRKTWQVRGDGSADNTLPAGLEVKGSARFAFAGLQLTQLRHQQEGGVQLGNGNGGGHIRFLTTTNLTRTAAAQTAWAKDLRPGALVAFSPAAEAKVTKVASGRGLPVLLQEMSAAAARGDWETRHRLGSELAGNLRGNDARAAEVGKQLRQPLEEPVQRTLLEALAEAGTPAAQRELVGVAGDAVLSTQLRTQALGAATFVKKPTEAMVSGLGDLAYDRKATASASAEFASNAAMAVAAAIGHQLVGSGQETSAAADQFVAEAEARIAPETSASPAPAPVAAAPGAHVPTEVPPLTGRARHNWIAAVGNAGLAQTAPLLVGLLGDSDEFSRSAAALSMRFLPTASVVPALVKHWPQEDSIHVRVSIIEACLYLGPGATKTLVHKALRFDKSELVRQAAAYTVAAWSHRTPALAELLQDALRHETSPSVAEAMQNYLKPGRVAAPFRLLSGTPEGQ